MTSIEILIVVAVFLGLAYAFIFQWKNQKLIWGLFAVCVVYLGWFFLIYEKPLVQEQTVVEQIAQDDMNRYCQEQGGCMGMQEFHKLEAVIKSSN